MAGITGFMNAKLNVRRPAIDSGHALVEQIVKQHGPLTKEEIFAKAGNIAPSSVRNAVSYSLIKRVGQYYSAPLSILEIKLLTSKWEFCYE